MRRREYERRVEAVLQAGIDSGEFRDVDPRLTALAWLGMHNYTYLWLKPGGRLSARDVAKPFADIFIRGIGQSTEVSAQSGGKWHRCRVSMLPFDVADRQLLNAIARHVYVPTTNTNSTSCRASTFTGEPASNVLVVDAVVVDQLIRRGNQVSLERVSAVVAAGSGGDRLDVGGRDAVAIASTARAAPTRTASARIATRTREHDELPVTVA